jgi:transcription elongation factor/antiterminator RfaH
MLTLEVTNSESANVCAALQQQKSLDWYAVYCRSHHERQVERQLQARQVDCFLPLHQRLRRRRDRKELATLPLFPGYVFVRIAPEERKRALTIPGVVSFVTVGGLPVAVPAMEIDALRACMERRIHMEPHPFLTKGRRVRITHGVFEDLEGVFVAKKNRFRLVLSITLINRSVAVELDSSDVTPI